MTQSQRILANIGALRENTANALMVFEVLDLLKESGQLDEGTLAEARRQLDLCEAKHAWLVADGPDALPTSVWFDLPPNEWWDAN